MVPAPALSPDPLPAPTVVEAVPAGVAPSAPTAPPVAEERRLITALFCDLVGFTPLTESLDAEEVRMIQGMYFAQMSQELHRFGGSVEKYAGDAVLALFGVPIAHEDDPERAVRCALAMQQAFKPVAEMAKNEYGRDLAVRIGVNTGEVVSGAWDVEGRLDYSATGDALNTAARLQTAAEPGGVIVGPQTMHLARRAVLFGPRRDLTLKGKSELFPAYPVLGLREEVAERWETQERTPLVGRERELIFLMDEWKRVQAGEARLVTVIAEAGVGKSRLLAEAMERMRRAMGTVVLRGRCLSHGEGMSLHLVADLLRSMCQLHEGDASDRIRDQVRVTVDALLAPWDAETGDAAADVLGSVLGLPPGPSRVTHASPQVRRQTLVRSLQLLLSALSTYRPAIVLLEDLHWVDHASVEVLDAVLPALSDRQAMLLVTRRPGRAAPWEDQPESASLPLEPLDGGDAIALARAVLGGAELEPDLERQIADRAGGNPFFVEELLRSMQETSALRVREGRMGLVPGAAEQLPYTLTELLLARLDKLDSPARSTAQHGSVIGRTFSVPLLARVSEQEVERLHAPLDTLERAEIAFPQQEAELEYVFKHATIREVAYSTLLLRRRRTLHAATARAIIELYPVDEQVDVIAYHFSQTHEHGDAAVWLERSGDRAASIFANEEAIEQYREARRRQDMIDAPRLERARIDEKIGHILRILGQYGDGLQALAQSAEIYRAEDDRESERRATAEIGRLHRAQGTPGEGITRIAEILERHAGEPPTGGLAALHVVLARLYYNLGRYEDEVQAAGRGSELATLVGDRHVLAEGEMSRGVGLYHLRQIEDALRVMEEAIPVAEAVGDFEALWNLLGNTAIIYRDGGQLERSLQYRERSTQIAERMGDRGGYAFALSNLGELNFLLGNWDDAQAYLERAMPIVRSLGPSWFSSYPPALLGQLQAARGDFDTASDHLQEALSIARQGDNHQHVVLAIAYLAEMELLRGQPEVALRHVHEVLDLSKIDKDDATLTGMLPIAAWAQLESGDTAHAGIAAHDAVKRLTEENDTIEGLAAYRVLAAVAAGQGDYERAERTFKETIALARHVRCPYAEGRALHEYGMMHLRQGDHVDARQLLQDGLTLFRRLGARPYIDRTELALAHVSE